LREAAARLQAFAFRVTRTFRFRAFPSVRIRFRAYPQTNSFSRTQFYHRYAEKAHTLYGVKKMSEINKSFYSCRGCNFGAAS
jgi:hypothetical protein